MQTRSHPPVTPQQALYSATNRIGCWWNRIPSVFAVLPALLVLSGLIGATSSAWASTDDRIVARAFVEDPTGSLDLESVRKLPATPYEGVLNRGYGDSVIWLRLTLAPFDPADSKAALDRRLVLRIQPTYLDEVALHDPLDITGQPRRLGDRHPWTLNETASLNFTFVVPDAPESRDIWLRLTSTSTRLLHVDALPETEANRADYLQLIIYSLYLSLVAIFFGWALVDWLLHPERVIGAFAVMQCCALAYSLNYIGVTRLLLSDQMAAGWLDQFTSLSILVYCLSSIWFHRRLIADFQPVRWMLHLITAQGAGVVLAMLLWLSGRTTQALELNLAVVSLVPLTTLLITIFGVKSNTEGLTPPALSKPILIAFYALMLAAIWISSLPALGIAPADELAAHTFLVHGFLTGTILMVMLQYRAARLNERRLQQVAVATERAEQESNRRIEQSRFVAMLSHELKTPLSVLRMAVESPGLETEVAGRASRAVRDMNDVIERCLQVDRLADNQIQPVRDKCDLLRIVSEVISSTASPERIALQGLHGPHTVFTDARLLRIVVANLVDNALKYGREGGAIEISVGSASTDAGDRLALTVSNAPGAAGKPDPAKVFQKYYRAPRAHERVGSGLGLYLTASIARMLGGEMRYLAEDERIRFQLCLPQ